MKETKFTPGPWKAEPDSYKEYSAWSVYATNEINGFICQTSGNCEPNASLISYSPNMYEVLEELIPILNYAINSTPSGDLRNHITEINVKIQLILDKIKG